MDVVDTTTRSRMMSGIKGKNTRPELIVRQLLHAAGFRYRLHRRDLPGTPDLVLRKYRTAIFIHGCFWHMHEDCRFSKVPESNTEFWIKKLSQNKNRDENNVAALHALGWRIMIIWECAVREPAYRIYLQQRMKQWIKGNDTFAEISASLT